MVCREPLNALEQLEASLETSDDASWYAARLELLGTVIFGDLWKSGESKAADENSKPS
jgi:hypothetical protein